MLVGSSSNSRNVESKNPYISAGGEHVHHSGCCLDRGPVCFLTFPPVSWGNILGALPRPPPDRCGIGVIIHPPASHLPTRKRGHPSDDVGKALPGAGVGWWSHDTEEAGHGASHQSCPEGPHEGDPRPGRTVRVTEWRRAGAAGGRPEAGPRHKEWPAGPLTTG